MSDAFAHYEPVEVDEDELPFITMEEVSRHNTEEDAWIVIYGRVYDVTEWMESHPGGDDILIDNAGTDVSEIFRSVSHSPDANAIRPNFIIGKLAKPDSKL